MKVIIWAFITLGFIGCRSHDENIKENANSSRGRAFQSENVDSSYFNDKLPAIYGKNHKGTPIDLRKIQSKYILLEFWASWCPPCRRANPALVEVYKKYKKQDFEIVSISLDTKSTLWTKAIEDDNLFWPYHLCEYQGWNSKWAASYTIEEIPNNVLYNSDGVIVAKAMDPLFLDKTLQQLLAK